MTPTHSGRLLAALGAPFGRRQRGEFGFAFLGLVPGVIGGALTLVFLAVGTVLSVINIGLLILAGVLIAARGLGAFHRGMLRVFLGEQIPAPPRPAMGGGALRSVRAVLTNSDGWRAVAYLMINIPASVLLFAVLVGVRIYGVAFLTYPLWWRLLDDHGRRGLNSGIGNIQLDTWPLALLVTAVGVGVLALSTWGGSRLAALVRFAGRSLLGPSRLSSRVRDLEETRTLAVADSAAVLRRIERDLHDGAQTRLVGLAMSLTMAKDALADAAPSERVERARELIDSALQGSQLALQELRDLVRGIHPPLLDVGLAEALESLVSGSALPVRVEVRLERRPIPAVEAIAYFCAAELIANAARHSGADEVAVSVVEQGDDIVIVVRDDGSGGASVGSGTGLTGLTARLRPVDGELRLSSPPGGPTVATVIIPRSGTAT